MNIQGIQKVTLLDFPGKIACTVFVSGCNFRCPFCHNPSLVTVDKNTSPEMSEEDFFAFLAGRTGKLDGVCVTGGEPLLQPDIQSFLRKIRNLGFAVKLDTNGSFPSLLKELLDYGLLDYVAMDIKNAPDCYGPASGLKNPPMKEVEESIRILLSGTVPFEFRTTVVDELHDAPKMKKLAQWICGAPRYYLQEFSDSGDILRPGLHACSPEKMHALSRAAAEYVPSVKIRGE